MTKQLSDIPVSVLDLATIRQGNTIAQAFENSLDLARHADRLGYKRYWLAEHHNMESIASAATSVLIGYIANGTKRIRVGSGGIMLPNHAPLIIAEQFGTLEALFPGRIDLGIGRAPGTDPITSMALRRNLKGGVDEFPNDVIELLEYFAPRNPTALVRAIPGEGMAVPVWLLGSSTYSAQLAAMLGLCFAFASHFAPHHLFDALKIYKENFKHSLYQERAYAMACVNVIVGETDEEAEHLSTSFKMLALGLIKNQRKPLQPPVQSMATIWNAAEEAAVQQMMQYSFIGSKSSVKNKLQSFITSTGVEELMVTTHLYDHEKRIKSYEMLSDLFSKS
ncbi:MAG: LLM class flavin-dependent oxidoreductase [Ginsengibacter sp.]